MRGGDGCGVSALLEKQLVLPGNDMQTGRHPRRSGRRESSSLSPNSSNHSRVGDLTLNGRVEGPGRSSNSSSGIPVNSTAASSSSTIGREGGGTSGRGRSDGGGLAAVDNSKPGRPPRRGGRGDAHLNGRGSPNEAPVRNGGSGSGSPSSSMRSDPAGRSQRHAAGVPARDRTGKRGRGETQNPLAAVNGDQETNLVVVQDQGRSEVQMGDASSRDVDRQEGSPRERLGEYFPMIHDELGLQCLTRLPRHKIYKMALVCKKWKEYLTSSELYKARHDLGVRESWVFLLATNSQQGRWRAFLPQVGDWVALPACPSDYTFDSCDKESMVAGLNLLVLGQDSEGYVIWKFDTIKSKWSTTPRMHADRCMFGSATWGKYAYFAGGSGRGTVLKSVERYNSETNSWELLADMNHDRKACSGFVMDDKFYVIGGQVLNNILSSGEAYDPLLGTWTVIEGMWPQEFVPSTQVSPPLVAVLENQLYAINITQNMLMLYDKDTNQWKLLEKVPFRAENNNGWGLGFKAVGDELFVIGGPKVPGHFLPKIHAYRPRADGGDTWRLVTDLKIPTNGFIYNCAVMSG